MFNCGSNNLSKVFRDWQESLVFGFGLVLTTMPLFYLIFHRLEWVDVIIIPFGIFLIVIATCLWKLFSPIHSLARGSIVGAGIAIIIHFIVYLIVLMLSFFMIEFSFEIIGVMFLFFFIMSFIGIGWASIPSGIIWGIICVKFISPKFGKKQNISELASGKWACPRKSGQ